MIDNKGLVLCLTPVYNDWESLNELVDEIRGVFSELADKKFKILAIDDGSTEQNKYSFNKSEVEIISLKKNIGHQRAIAIGIQYVYNKYLNNQLSEKKLTAHHLVVLDSDGEDSPSDILSMVDAADQQVVFAQRTKRSETLSFKLGYWFYKKIFRLLTGKSISFGNFSAIPEINAMIFIDGQQKKVIDGKNLLEYFSILYGTGRFDKNLKQLQRVNDQGLSPIIIAKKKLIKQIFHNQKDQTQNVNQS